MQRQPAYMFLANGERLVGWSLGKVGETTGELVFTTAIVGYMETISDPSNQGLIVIQTFPQIGNYGVITQDMESERAHIGGYVIKSCCDAPSNFRQEGPLGDWLKAQGVVAIEGLDTRYLTRQVRTQGSMNARITPKAELSAEEWAQMREPIPAQWVGAQKASTLAAQGERCARVAVWDFGAKRSMLDALRGLGCEVMLMPAASTAKEILATGAQGVVLSEGPGDPREARAVLDEVGALVKSGIALMGVGLGHQLLALSQGAHVRKMPFGHRGGQAVRDCDTGRVYATAQNHGYVVDTLPHSAHLRLVNASDGGCEGIDYPHTPMFSVQFGPGGEAGPRETAYLYERFLNMVKEANFHA